MLKYLLDLVFPPKCKICGIRCMNPICDNCLGSFPKIDGGVCDRCGKPCRRDVSECRECTGREFHFLHARSGGIYSGALKDAIHLLKYKNGKALAPYLARFLSNSLSDFIDDVDRIAFVPLTKYKEATRGYNQSRLIAEELAKLHNKPLYTGLLKVKDIQEQNKLGLSDRSSNVKGAFGANLPLSGKIVLVDDVYTTGSTANECALALKQSGASEVLILTVARTPMETTSPHALFDV